MDVLCEALEAERNKSLGSQQEVFQGLYAHFHSEYVSACQNFASADKRLNNKVLMVGYESDGKLGSKYVDSLVEAEQIIGGKQVFNGPVVVYEFRVLDIKGTFVENGGGRIVNGEFHAPHPETRMRLYCIPEDTKLINTYD